MAEASTMPNSNNLDPSIYLYVSGRVHPCCGYSLQKASVILSIIHMTTSAALAIFLGLLAIALAISHEDIAKANFDEGTVGYWRHKLGLKLIVLLLVVTMTAVLSYFCLSNLLFRGAKEMCFRKVNLWWRIMLVVTVALLVENIILAIRYKSESKVGIFEALEILFFLYSLWVVHEFKRELQRPSESTVEFDRVLQAP